MDIETLREYCLGLKGTTEGMKWDHLCFMVADKIFALVSLDDGGLCIKCDPEDFDQLTAKPGIVQAPHFARRQWVFIENLEVLMDDELAARVAQSRRLVIAKLTKKLQQEYL